MAENYDSRMPGPMRQFELTKYEKATNEAAAALFAGSGPNDPDYADGVVRAMNHLITDGMISEEEYPVPHLLAQAAFLGRLATARMDHEGDKVSAGIIANAAEAFEQQL